MNIVMFALIGAYIKARVAYWICFGIYCAIKAVNLVIDLTKN